MLYPFSTLHDELSTLWGDFSASQFETQIGQEEREHKATEGNIE
jgi:hypothetical protein